MRYGISKFTPEGLSNFIPEYFLKLTPKLFKISLWNAFTILFRKLFKILSGKSWISIPKPLLWNIILFQQWTNLCSGITHLFLNDTEFLTPELKPSPDHFSFQTSFQIEYIPEHNSLPTGSYSVRNSSSRIPKDNKVKRFLSERLLFLKIQSYSPRFSWHDCSPHKSSHRTAGWVLYF